jgi:hypothetical protein
MPLINKNKPESPRVASLEESETCVYTDSAEPDPNEGALLEPASGYKFKFDFDVGYLVRSPCRKCTDQARLPVCADSCRILNRIHSILSRSVSCSRG